MTKLAFVLSFIVLLPISAAFAETSIRTDTSVRVVNAGIRVQSDENQNEGVLSASSSVTARAGEDRSATGTEAVDRSRQERADVSSTTENDNERGGMMSESHRSVMASFVKSLLADSERDGGIGEEVRAVAQSQQEAASTTVDAIAHMENRNAMMSFFLGTDWRSVGMLRSQIAKNEADLARLQAAIASSTDAGVKANLEAQVTVLSAEQNRIQAFIDAHANRFSLFGWLTKLFVGASISETANAQ